MYASLSLLFDDNREERDAEEDDDDDDDEAESSVLAEDEDNSPPVTAPVSGSGGDGKCTSFVVVGAMSSSASIRAGAADSWTAVESGGEVGTTGGTAAAAAATVAVLGAVVGYELLCVVCVLCVCVLGPLLAAKISYDLGSTRTSRQKRLLSSFATAFISDRADHDAKQHTNQPKNALRGASTGRVHFVSGEASLEEKLIRGTNGKYLWLKAGRRRLMVCGHFRFFPSCQLNEDANISVDVDCCPGSCWDVVKQIQLS
jgi:hypothetical protein